MRSDNPLGEGFQLVSTPFAFWDPHTFQDDDGRLYFYWGCSNKTPIYGVEMDAETLKPVGKKRLLFLNRLGKNGWERTEGYKQKPKNLVSKLIDLIIGDAPFIEGPFVTKYDGKYYLQYAAPGTEMLPYGDGVYVAVAPLGPYTVQAHNPFSTKPGGFITGAGHGSTMCDEHGNWWHASSMRISVNANFERRLGLFPCGFDEDGVLFCNQNFADYPYIVPEGKFDPWEITPKWMLLSYQKAVAASSAKPSHEAPLGVDESICTWWCADSTNAGEWYQVDLGDVYDVRAIQINFADEAVPNLKMPRSKMDGEMFQTRYIDLDTKLATRYLLEGSVDRAEWFVLKDNSTSETNLCHDYLLFENGIQARFVRVTGIEFPYGSAMAISGLRVFGHGNGEKPEEAVVAARRTGGMDAKISWDAVETARGYNVRYGIAPDKLYSSWLVYGTCELDLPFLDAEQPEYYVCVDAFNENGITQGKCVRIQ